MDFSVSFSSSLIFSISFCISSLSFESLSIRPSSLRLRDNSLCLDAVQMAPYWMELLLISFSNAPSGQVSRFLILLSSCLRSWLLFYTCQLSRIMRESHACGSIIVISRIQTNFSRLLSDNSECNYLKTFEKSSQHLRNSLIMFEIGWKSFGNRWRAVFWNRQKSFYAFGYLRKSSGNLRKSSDIFGNLRKSFENLGNLRKASVNLQKFRSCGDEKSHAFYWKKS